MAKVLLIEDDPGVRELLRGRLAEAGYEVSAAEDGSSGVVMAFFAKPDAVVLDLKMPGMDGRQVLHALKRHDARLPVFIFSVLGDFDNRTAGLEVADGCFVKSADLGPLVEALGRAVASGGAEGPVWEPARKRSAEGKELCDG